MNLPDRAKQLLDRLDEFALCPAMQTFRAEAEARFMPEERSVEPEDRVSFIDYVAFTHRDAQGHTCIGLFLEEHAGSLAPEMREAFERFEGSIFGVFKVEAVVPGSGLRLRDCGGDTTYEVVEKSASLTLQRGMGLIARLVPYRGRHELAGDVRMILPEVMYLTERLVAQHGDEARAWLADPIAQRALLRELERRPEPSKNRLEAEIGAEAVFTELRLPFTVADLQNRFQTMESPLPVLGELSGHAFASKQELDRATEALTSLWNHTPRDELGGLTPTEAHQAGASRGRPGLPEHLAMDLMNAAAAQLKPEDYPDEESYRRALAEFQRRWLETPQAELGGASPGYVMERPLPPLPHDASLPPSDRPAWTPEALSALLGSRDRRRALWALRWIAEHPQHPAPPDLGTAVGRVLDALLSDIELEGAGIPDASGAGAAEDDEDDLTPGSTRLAEALHVLGKLKGHPLARAATGAITDRRPRLIASHEDSYADTLSALADLDLEGNVPLLLEALQSDDQNAAADAAMALGKARHAPAAGLIPQLLRSPDLYPDVLADAFAALVSMGEGPVVEEACGTLMAAREDDDEIWRCLRTALDEVGVIRYMQFHFVEESLCPAGEAGGEAHPVSLEIFFPEADAGAARRACEVLPPEGVHQILDSLRRGPTSAAARLLAERTLEAVELARAANPLFGPLGGAIAAFTRKLLSWSRLSKLPVEALKEVIVLQGAFLLKAIHGHDLAREVEAAAGDPARLLDLCRVDEKWPTPQLLLGAAQKLQVEPLLEIRAAAGRDFDVESNINRLLAVLDPTRFLPAAAEDLEHDGEDREAVLGLIARSAGDACLRPYLENPPASRSAARSILNDLLARLGTERARAVLETTFELLAQSGPKAIDLLRTAMDCASPACAQALVDRLQSEENLFDLRETLDRGWELEEELETAFALFDLEGSPQEVLGALFTQLEELERREGVLSRAREQTDLDDDEDDSADVEAEVEDAIALDEDDAPRTIRRTEPKVGRNEKCPCGSGKKYKHCCGKTPPGS